MMALDVVGGPVLGLAFGELYKAIEDATKKVTGLESNLKKLEDTLKSIEPHVVKIKSLSDRLDRPTEAMRSLTKITDDGETLIRRCSEVSRHNCWKKWRYAIKIEEFKKKLTTLCQIDVPVQNCRNILEILDSVKSIKSVSCASEKLGSCEVPHPPAFMVGLDAPLKELKIWLRKKDEESMIVVSAPGGCGKTSLAQKLCHDPDVKEHFQHIFFVTISKAKSDDLIGLIKKLFSAIGEEAPEFQNEEHAVNQLQASLKKKVESARLLLVLDDVWSGSKSLLFDFKSKIAQIPGVKILVTSRTGFRGLGPLHNLKLLDDKDARAVFRYWAIPKDRSSSSVPDDLVNKIVTCCKGFPLVLEVVGRSLCGEPLDTWRSRLLKLSEGQSIVNDEDEVRDCLQKSLDALDDKDTMLKEYFMDLGSFPEDHRIPATALIDMYAELHQLDHSIHAISNLHHLCSRNLLKLVITRDDPNESVDFYSDAYVLQHDLLRDLAIFQCNQGAAEQRKRLILDLTGNRLPKWWAEEMQPRLRARLVSISTDEMSSSSWRNMQIPNAKVLLLNFNQIEKEYKLPELMKKMDELRALIVTNYGFYSTELTNFSVLSSLSNLRRIRLEKVSIPTLCNTATELKNLEKISLVMCHKIDQAFAMSTMEVKEMFPKLREINIDYCNDLVELPEGFCHLDRLNKLSITNCHKLSALTEEIGILENLEVLRVRACTSVSGLPESVASLHKLRVLDITDCFRMKNFPNGIGQVDSLREIHMRGCSNVCELPSSVANLVDLEKVICDEDNAIRWEFWKDSLHSLRLIVPEKVHSLSWL